MPAVRFSRDKRGYEYTYLVHTPTRRGKPGRTRVLYWYRTPPGVRIGRPPFDPDVQKLIEQQNPGVTFDWDTIVNTPMPPPDMTEYWRERRRLEKAARQERRAMEAGDQQTDSAEQEEQSAPARADSDGALAEEPTPDPPVDASAEGAELFEPAPVTVGPDGGVIADASTGARKRRRRRGGRRRKTEGEAGPGQATGADEGTGAVSDDDGSDPSEPDDGTSEGE